MASTVPIDLGRTAEILGITKGSIRNWIRHEYLKPIDSQGRFFDQDQVLKLKDDIVNGNLDRLKTRANKIRADKHFLPVEYVMGQENRKAIITLVNYIKEKKIDSRIAILVVAIRLFIDNKDIISSDLNEILRFPRDIFRRKNVYRELRGLFLFICEGKDGSVFSETANRDKENLSVLVSFPLPSVKDALGLIYQSLMDEGAKSRRGSYFTPTHIVDRMVRENIRSWNSVLDPCCGTGQFLLCLAKYLTDPKKIWGIDLDPMAVHIARLNLLLECPQDFKPKIYHLDSLKEVFSSPPTSGDDLSNNEDIGKKKFDFIATNPPWGAELDMQATKKLKMEFPAINSGESFSYFLNMSLAMLKNGGVLSFVLPQSILNVKTHRDIRKMILDNTRIKTIEGLGKVFKNVLSSVIILELVKTEAKEDDEITVKLKNKQYKVLQKKFKSNDNYIFDIHMSPEDVAILHKMYSTRYVSLKNNAQWALGIVTGDNKRYLTSECKEGYEPVYKGSDVSSYVLGKPSSYIRFCPKKFQQVAAEEKYRSKEKLIYRFISNKLVFAYDVQGSLTLNSANILIPRLTDYPVKVIMALFNSTLYRLMYQKKFNSIKVLRGDLEQLPLPLWSKESFAHISEIADRIIAGEDLTESLDTFIMEQFGLSLEERIYIINNTALI